MNFMSVFLQDEVTQRLASLHYVVGECRSGFKHCTPLFNVSSKLESDIFSACMYEKYERNAVISVWR